MKYLICLLLLWITTACGDLQPKTKNPLTENANPAAVEPSTDVSDEQEDDGSSGDVNFISFNSLKKDDQLFENNKWYSYNILNHRVYPLFDIYALKSNQENFYKIQIIDYYADSESSQGGNYKLRMQDESEAVQTVVIAATGCGDPIGGVSEVCEDGDVYTLISLDTLQITNAGLEEAFLRSDWDLAFHRTSIFVNSKGLGVGQTEVALLYSHDNFFNGFGIPRYERLLDAYVNGGLEDIFMSLGTVAE